MKNNIYKKFSKFFITNLSGTAIDTAVLFVLKQYVFNSYFGIYIVSPIIGFEVAMFNNFTISYFWIWHKRVHYNLKDFSKKLIKYNISVSLTFGIRLLIIITVERLTGLDVIYCNFIALIISGLINFTLGEKWVFIHKKKDMKDIIKEEN